ncbi:MAG: PQQ-binding-like beta-propeller repeat protein [Acidobacteriota bacterium]|nr:PQQ-binding-like beta-propeller repeat protein [Acidobacteriota bacterium]
MNIAALQDIWALQKVRQRTLRVFRLFAAVLTGAAVLTLVSGLVFFGRMARAQDVPRANPPAAEANPRSTANAQSAPQRPLVSEGAMLIPKIPPPSGVVKNYQPVTTEMLVHPSPDDWLMYSRTYDAQRYSPLKQVNTKNVKDLALAWARGLPDGVTETIPIEHAGVLYVIVPGGDVDALDATTGDLIWEYKRDYKNKSQGATERTKALAIYDDIVYFTAPDGYVVAIDAKTGKERWETFKPGTANTSGALVVDGKVISGGTCIGGAENCFIEADDAETGKEVWRFHTVAMPGDPGNASWNGADMARVTASTWGMPGSFDPARNVLYWGVANPMPDQRMLRHGGNPDGTSRTTPADLYSNCTLAIDPATGKLIWYYQHLPGDDWDTDHTHERTLASVAYDPDPKQVKWFNPDVPRGSKHEIAAMVSEGGGVFVLDRANGKFLWATPFPFDDPEHFYLSSIDGRTGKATLNWNIVFQKPGDHHVICYWNTRSYWPTAYDPDTNSLYVPYTDNCRDLTLSGPGTRGGWAVIPRPGTDPNRLTGMEKINLSTGDQMKFDIGRAPGNGAVLATAGGLIFHGDMSRRFKAFDARTGKQLWQAILGGNVSVSTITYAVNGKQYICVMTGYNLKVPELSAEAPALFTPEHSNEIYVFALP